MKPPTHPCRILLTALVCLLAVGVFALGAQAKRSQYPGAGTGFTKHLSKEAKMSDDRTQKVVAVMPVLPAVPRPAAVPVIYPPLPEVPAPALSFDFLEAFSFRPPPSA